jgi:hypothetical protein
MGMMTDRDTKEIWLEVNSNSIKDTDMLMPIIKKQTANHYNGWQGNTGLSKNFQHLADNHSQLILTPVPVPIPVRVNGHLASKLFHRAMKQDLAMYLCEYLQRREFHRTNKALLSIIQCIKDII